jgi:hypothetical protein
MVQKAGGNYDKLSDADKQKVISLAGGEAQAKSLVSRMSQTPQQMNAGRGGRPEAPPKAP